MPAFDLFERRLSWHYLNEVGRKFFGVIGASLDAVTAGALDAVTASMVRRAPAAALPELARSFALPLPERHPFGEAKQRGYITDAWDIWDSAGATARLVAECARLGYPNVQVRPVWSFTRTLGMIIDTIDIQATVPEYDEQPLFVPDGWPDANPYVRFVGSDGTWDTVEEGRWWLQLNYHWSSYFLDVGPPLPLGTGTAARWDGGARWDDEVAVWDASPQIAAAHADLVRLARAFGRGARSLRFVRYQLTTEPPQSFAIVPVREPWEYESEDHY